MKGKKTIRRVTFNQAAEEDLQFSLSLTPLERLQRLEELRRRNFGDKVKVSISRKIMLLEPGHERDN